MTKPDTEDQMTDIIVKMACAIRKAFRTIHGYDGKWSIPTHTSTDVIFSKAALSAIKEDFHLVPKDKPESIVKPLVWESPSGRNNQCHIAEVGDGAYYVHCDGGLRHAFYLPSSGLEEWIEEGSACLETEKVKCNAHHASRVLSLLNLEESE